MPRQAVIAGWGILCCLLAAQAGCSWLELRQDAYHTKLTREQVAWSQQLSEDAQAAIDCHDYERARADLLQLAAQAQGAADALQRLGSVLALEGRFGDAETCFRSALDREPNYVEALIGLGEIEVQKGDVASALKRFETAIEIDPHRARAHFCKARLLENLGQADQALPEYFRALEFDPNNAEIGLRIAAIQLGQNEPDQALARLDSVVELAAENGEARFLRGQAYVALGHLTPAIADFHAAAARLPHRPDIYYRLALALEADRKPDEALRISRQALNLAPNDPGAMNLTQRLAALAAPLTPGRTKLIANPHPINRMQAPEEGPAEPAR
jgi:tetratricopeptide (TPR) repeat protein